MHIAGKIFLGLGVLMLIGGGIMTIGGGSALEDAAEWDPEEKSEFSGATGDSSYSYPGDWEDKLVMVRDNVRCDEFTITMTNATNENHLLVIGINSKRYENKTCKNTFYTKTPMKIENCHFCC